MKDEFVATPDHISMLRNHPVVEAAPRCVFCEKPFGERSILSSHYRKMCCGGTALQRHVAASVLHAAEDLGLVFQTPDTALDTGGGTDDQSPGIVATDGGELTAADSLSEEKTTMYSIEDVAESLPYGPRSKELFRHFLTPTVRSQSSRVFCRSVGRSFSVFAKSVSYSVDTFGIVSIAQCTLRREGISQHFIAIGWAKILTSSRKTKRPI